MRAVLKETPWSTALEVVKNHEHLRSFFSTGAYLDTARICCSHAEKPRVDAKLQQLRAENPNLTNEKFKKYVDRHRQKIDKELQMKGHGGKRKFCEDEVQAKQLQQHREDR